MERANGSKILKRHNRIAWEQWREEHDKLRRAALKHFRKHGYEYWMDKIFQSPI